MPTCPEKERPRIELAASRPASGSSRSGHLARCVPDRMVEESNPQPFGSLCVRDRLGTLPSTIQVPTGGVAPPFSPYESDVLLLNHAGKAPGGNRTLVCCLQGSGPAAERQGQKLTAGFAPAISSLPKRCLGLLGYASDARGGTRTPDFFHVKEAS